MIAPNSLSKDFINFDFFSGICIVNLSIPKYNKIKFGINTRL